jgi:glycosyltransferase involved in cell wall biosynthesis
VFLLPGSVDEDKLQIQIGEALVRVLSQNDLRLELIRRSCAMYEQFFAWPAIAKRYAEFLQPAKQ